MKCLFFSPYAVIHDWRFSEYFLQKSLSKNTDLTILGCKGFMQKSCVAIKAHTKNYQNEFFRKKICKRCTSNQKKYSKDNKIFYLDDYLTSQEVEKINNLISNLNKSNFLKFKYDNFELGKIALFENMLIFKKNELNFSDKEFESLKNTIFTLLGIIKSLNLINKIFKPDFVISQNGNYSSSKLFNSFFKKQNISNYSWEASNHYYKRFDKIFLCKSDNNYGLNYLKKNWISILKNKKINNKNLESVNKHIETIVNAKALRSFSKGYNAKEQSLRDFYNIKTEKIILLNTSSWDEVIGTYILKNKKINELMIFDDQEDWISNVIKFLKDKKNFTLLIRPHPRDFFNKNSKTMLYLKNLKNNENIIINKPDHEISLYSIFKDTNLVLNSWSTLGMEAGIFNLPTISISEELTLYPKELELFASDSKNYFEKIENFLDNSNDDFNLERCKNFYKFMVNYVDHCSLQLSIKRNKTLFNISKLIDKLTLPVMSKSVQFYFNGYGRKVTDNSEILYKFFLNKHSVLNEIREDNPNNIKEDDFKFKYFFYSLARTITKDNEDNILSRKIKSIEQSVKSRK